MNADNRYVRTATDESIGRLSAVQVRAHQDQTLGPFTTEHANILIQNHTAIFQYRIGENGRWNSIDSSRTIQAPPEPPPTSKPKQPTASAKTIPILLDRELADVQRGLSVTIGPRDLFDLFSSCWLLHRQGNYG